jgi:16S rRNA (cytosine967-C5)-methyltransferase
MAYTGIGERSALLKASRQLGLNNSNDLRQAHRLIMETTRFQNRVDWLISQSIPEETIKQASHGIRSLLKIIAYSKYVDAKSANQLEIIVGWARQIFGWRDLQPYEEYIARLVSSSRRYDFRDLPELERVAVETCHPAWYVERLMQIFGRSLALKILIRNLRPVSTFARVNPIRNNDESLVAKQLNAVKVNGVSNAYLLETSSQQVRAKLSASGEIVIQDLASIVAGLVASPRAGQSVLDVCASPGNKTTHLAAQMGNQGEIYSIELSANRVLHWKQEVARSGCSIASPIVADASTPLIKSQVDVAMVDPPCSNTGVFARDPVSKWRVTLGRIAELSLRQSVILQAASGHVRSGGTLVYCTCSILPEENEFIVETFLKRNPEFTLVPQTPFIGSPGLRGLTKCQRFYSHLHDCNGYFISKMEKAS